MKPSARFDLLAPIRRFVGNITSTALREALLAAKQAPESLEGPGWTSFFNNPNIVSIHGQMAEIKSAEQAYRLVSWVNRAIGSVIESSRRAGLLIYKARRREQARELGWSAKAKAAGENLSPVSDPMELLLNPLRDYSCGWDELFEQTLGHFLLRGWVGWYCPLGTGGRPVTILVVPRSAVNQVIIEGGKLVGYQIWYGGKLKDVKAEEMSVMKSWNPESQIEGLSRLEAVMLTADTDRAESQAAKTIARRGGYQLGTYSTDDKEFSPIDAMASRAMLESSYGGPQEAYRTPILTNGLKWQRTGISLRELNFIEQRGFNRSEIGGIYGVPPIRMGDWSQSYYNSREQSRSFWLDAIEPLLKRFKRFLDSQFLTYWDSSRALASDWDTADIAELQDDRVELATVVSQLVVNRVMSPNEVRAEYYGRLPYPGGDAILAGLGLAPVGNAPAPKPDSPADQQRAASKDINEAYLALLGATQPAAKAQVKGLEIPDTADALSRWWRLLDSVMAPQARRLGQLVRSRVISDFIDPVSEAIREGALDPLVVLNHKALAEKLAEKSLPLVRSFYEQAGERAEGVAGAKAVKFDLDAARQAHVWSMVLNWSDNTTEGLIKTMADNIGLQISAGVNLLASHDEIVAGLKDSLGTEYRAELASRTIVQSANNDATLQGWGESQVVDGKRWLAGPPGERRRPVHQEMSGRGEVYALGEPFVLPNGATGPHPGAMSPMDENYNCGCVMVAALKQLPS